MKRRWNWLPWLGFGAAVAAFLSYFLYFYRFPATRDFPWVNLLLFLLALGLAGGGLRRAFWQAERYRGKVSSPIFGVLTLSLFAFFVYYTFGFSGHLPASAGAPRVGQVAPDFTLTDSHGQPVTLSEMLDTGSGSWVLLVFYRGYW